LSLRRGGSLGNSSSRGDAVNGRGVDSGGSGDLWVSGYISQGGGRTHRDGGLSVFDLEVIGRDDVTEARLLDVVVQQHRSERSTSGGEVGRGLERRGLVVDEDGVSVSSGSLGGSWSSVISAAIS
jgi:hypothetical protein